MFLSFLTYFEIRNITQMHKHYCVNKYYVEHLKPLFIVRMDTKNCCI